MERSRCGKQSAVGLWRAHGVFHSGIPPWCCRTTIVYDQTAARSALKHPGARRASSAPVRGFLKICFSITRKTACALSWIAHARRRTAFSNTRDLSPIECFRTLRDSSAPCLTDILGTPRPGVLSSRLDAGIWIHAPRAVSRPRSMQPLRHVACDRCLQPEIDSRRGGQWRVRQRVCHILSSKCSACSELVSPRVEAR
jgi:hypothetical protein